MVSGSAAGSQELFVAKEFTLCGKRDTTLCPSTETGTLDAGKRADVVVWDADPFTVGARARQVPHRGAGAVRLYPPSQDATPVRRAR